MVVKLIKNKLVSNILSLGIVQIINLLNPIIIIPVLIKNLSEIEFADYNIYLSIITILTVFTDWGFNLSATKKIAQNKEDKNYLSQILFDTIYSKLFLVFISFFFFLPLSIFFAKNIDFVLILVIYIYIAILSIIPTWYFQGTQNLKLISIINTFIKVLNILFIYAFININSNLINIFLVNILFNAVYLIICFIIIKNDNIYIRNTNFLNIKKNIKEGYYIFLSNLSLAVYLNSNLLIVSKILPPSLFVIYSVADKFYSIVKHPINIIFQVLYPYSCEMFTKSIINLVSILRKVSILTIVLYLLVTVFVYNFSNLISIYFLKSIEEDLVIFLLLFSLVPIIISINLPSSIFLIILNKEKQYFKIQLIASILSILLTYTFVRYYGMFGVILSVISVEIFVTLASKWIVSKSLYEVLK